MNDTDNVVATILPPPLKQFYGGKHRPPSASNRHISFFEKLICPFGGLNSRTGTILFDENRRCQVDVEIGDHVKGLLKLHGRGNSAVLWPLTIERPEIIGGYPV